MTDAQAWMLLHHLTNSGVLLLFVIPKKTKSRPAKVAGAVAGVALGTLDTAVGAVTAPAAKVKGAFTKNAAEEPETKDSDQ